MIPCDAAELVYPATGPSPLVRCRLAARVQDNPMLFDPTDCTPYTACSLWQRHRETIWERLQHARKM